MERKVGEIGFTLTYKKVKNINMRVDKSGNVKVSCPKGVQLSFIDNFVGERAQWIRDARAKIKVEEKSSFTKEEALLEFNKISDEIYPLFKDYIKEKPQIKVREMKSCYGVCHYKKGYITLNLSLMGRERELIEYVVMHEYAHFLQPNHQKGFHELMARLMPGYKELQKRLK